MQPEVDSGSIIQVDRFKIATGESADSLALRAGAYCLTQFYEIVSNFVLPGAPLPNSNESWGDELFTYAKLNRWKKEIKQKFPNHLCLQ